MNLVTILKKKLKFYKLLGLFLFAFTYFFICIQLYAINWINDVNNISYLNYFKSLAFTLIIFSIICHLRASFTDPGKITHTNNLEYLDFYCSSRTVAVKRAETLNSAMKHLIRPPYVDEDFEDYSDWENDDNTYENSLIFTNDKIEILNKKFGYDISICKKCKVGRMPGVHHCSICEGCVYQMDHHCPWLNNCVGQFNQKFFIQFCFYSLLASLVCAYISIYYMAFKQPKLLIENFRMAILLIGQMVLSVCSVFLFGRLLYDQYDNLNDMMNNYDPVKNKMIEKRSSIEVMYEVFGCLPSIWWLLPVKKGGLYYKFKSIKFK